MALLWAESFDGAVTAAVLTVKYDTASTLPFGGPSATVARTGTYSLKMFHQATDVLRKTLSTSGSTCIFGLALFVPSGTLVSAATPTFFMIREGSTLHVAIGMDSTLHLTVYRNATLLATSAAALSQNTWYYIEGKVVIDDTAGSYDIHVDAVSAMSASAQDTRNGGAGTWDNFQIASPINTSGSAQFVYIDDLYVSDGTGSAPQNAMLGTVGHLPKVDLQLPKTDAAGAGSHADFTPSTGTDHGALVDEATPNGDTDYNASSTVGHKETYQMTALSIGGTIWGRQANLYLKKTDAGARTIQIETRQSGTDYNGSSQSPLTTYAFLSDVRQVDPATTAAWTNGGINSEEVGLTIAT